MHQQETHQQETHQQETYQQKMHHQEMHQATIQVDRILQATPQAILQVETPIQQILETNPSM